jgi:Histidine kinase-like ATPase domain
MVSDARATSQATGSSRRGPAPSDRPGPVTSGSASGSAPGSADRGAAWRQLSVSVEPQMDALADLRASVASWLDPDRLSESELGANAIEASRAGEQVHVEVGLDARAVVVEVRNRSRRQTPVPLPVMADPLAPRGRGLAIVASLADELSLREVDGCTVARATLPRS